MTYYADITIQVTVAFHDESDLCLEDQAIEMVNDRIYIPHGMLMGMELVGPVRTTEDIVDPPSDKFNNIVNFGTTFP